MMNVLEDDLWCFSLLFCKTTENLPKNDTTLTKENEEVTEEDDYAIKVVTLKDKEDRSKRRDENHEKDEKGDQKSEKEKDDALNDDEDMNEAAKIEMEQVDRKIHMSFHFHDNEYTSELLHSAEVFCRNNWNISGQSLISLIPNPFMLLGSTISISISISIS